MSLPFNTRIQHGQGDEEEGHEDAPEQEGDTK
jgi:hypothetical protein